MVIVFPLLFLLILLIAQYAVWAHATHTAQATAAHALAAARMENGSAADGHAEAQRVLDQLGRASLEGPKVTVTRDTDRAEIRIRGTARPVLPFLHLPAQAEASGKVEAFRPDIGRGS